MNLFLQSICLISASFQHHSIIALRTGRAPWKLFLILCIHYRIIQNFICLNSGCSIRESILDLFGLKISFSGSLFIFVWTYLQSITGHLLLLKISLIYHSLFINCFFTFSILSLLARESKFLYTGYCISDLLFQTIVYFTFSIRLCHKLS